MSIERTGASALDYFPSRYGNSRLLFRGPKRGLDKPYILFLGGSTTYGKFVHQPYPGLVETYLSQDCVNLGCLNAGIDSFLHDPDVLSIANSAEMTVLELPGAQNLSNRFYRVHPRRNDRFLGASPLLQSVYREVDFTEFNFNKHMLGHLQVVSPDRFEAVRDELRQAWLARMRMLLGTIRSNVVLLWLRTPAIAGGIGLEPLMVSSDMVADLVDDALETVCIDLPDIGQPEDMEGMVFDQMEAPAARQTPGPASHERIARRLVVTLGEQM